MRSTRNRISWRSPLVPVGIKTVSKEKEIKIKRIKRIKKRRSRIEIEFLENSRAVPTGSFTGEIPVWESPTVIGFYTLLQGSAFRFGGLPAAVNVACFTKLPPLFRRFLPPLQKLLLYLKGFPYYGLLREYYGSTTGVLRDP